MAELLLIAKDDPAKQPTYEDGDVLGAANWRSIRCEHASRICDRYKPEHRNGGGLIALGSLAELWYRHTSQYRFERVSRNEIKRVNQWTGSEVTYGSTPVEDPDRPGKVIHCAVDDFFRRRKRHRRHVVCGSDGAEVYYEGDGRKDLSHARLDLVWGEITNETGLQDTDFPHVPLSTVQLKRFLVLPVDDFDDATAGELTLPLIDDSDPDNPVTLKKRKHHVAWRDLFPINIPPSTSADDVLDVRKPVDPRLRSAGGFLRSSIVLTKSV